jgi:hypothetical protein
MKNNALHLLVIDLKQKRKSISSGRLLCFKFLKNLEVKHGYGSFMLMVKWLLEGTCTCSVYLKQTWSLFFTGV